MSDESLKKVEHLIKTYQKEKIKINPLEEHLIKTLAVEIDHINKKMEDLNNKFFRSKWEANYARYLNYIGVKWEYEPKRFWFDAIKTGTRSYQPDFYLIDEDIWVEVKGWMDAQSKTRLKRFKKYYPEEYSKLIIVDQHKYRIIEKEFSNIIPTWEKR